MASERILELLRRPSDPDEHEAIRELWKTHSIAEDNRDLPGLISTLTDRLRLHGRGHRRAVGRARGRRALLHGAPDRVPGHPLRARLHRDRTAGRLRGGDRHRDAPGAVARARADGREARRGGTPSSSRGIRTRRLFKGEMVYTDLTLPVLSSSASVRTAPTSATTTPRGTPGALTSRYRPSVPCGCRFCAEQRRRPAGSGHVMRRRSPCAAWVAARGPGGRQGVYDRRPWISISSSSGPPRSAPTASRGASATLVRRGGDRLLVDCGEGTQRQLLRSDAGLVDLERGLPHAPARRSRPRAARHAEDVRAARPGGPTDRLRAERNGRADAARSAS